MFNNNGKTNKKRFRKSKRKLKRTNIKSRKKCMRGGYRGTIVYPDNDSNGYANYKGQISVERNIPHGQGEMKWTNNDVYNGEWHFGKRNGSGTMKYHNETKYTGKWKNNKKHGYGSMHYQNGKKYVGQWYKDIRQGIGSLHYNDGKIAKGNWVNDVPTGPFIMIWPVNDKLLSNYKYIDATDLDDFELDNDVSECDTDDPNDPND
jgi:hypothetical protein